MSAIRAAVRRIARRFRPHRIILFGSHAYGHPGRESDVDLLVVASTREPLELAGRILEDLDGRFPLDIIVRTPSELARARRAGDSFIETILTKGRLLYEGRRTRVG